MTLGLARLTALSLLEMARYDLANLIFGFKHVRNILANQHTGGRLTRPRPVDSICEAVNLAACFYFKPVRCLQKSVVTARLLNTCGIESRIVIGYRQSPFFSHAWVEVDGRVVNDSPAYKEQLKVFSEQV